MFFDDLPDKEYHDYTMRYQSHDFSNTIFQNACSKFRIAIRVVIASLLYP